MLDTVEDIDSFMILHNKSEIELRAICEGLQLDINGEKAKLIQRLLTLSIRGQSDYKVPQAIALRTQVDGKPIPGAVEFMKKIRNLIFKNRNVKQEFHLLNGINKSYKATLSFVGCPEDMLSEVLNKDLYIPRTSQKELVSLLKTNPKQFITKFINKPSKDGKNFVMLHVMPRRAT